MNGRIKRAETAPRLNFPKIGSIRCGKKATKNGKEFPVSTDYFVPAGTYAKYFSDVYGEKPTTIQVVFLDDDPSLVCNERFELRNKEGRLVAYGDGLDYMVFDDAKEKYLPFSLNDYPEMLERLQIKHGGEWDTVLTLRFLIPAIAGIVGYWELSTKAKASSIPEITAIFDQVLSQKGFVKGILFDLHVKIHVSNKPNSRSRYPVISLVPNHSKENKSLIEKHFLINEGADLQGKRIGG